MRTIQCQSKTRNLQAYTLPVFILLAGNLFAQTSGDYRTSSAGNWSNASNWEEYNGSTWAVASTAPDYTNGAISVTRSMTISTDLTLDDVTISSSGSVTINSSKTLSLNGDITDNGSITANGTINCQDYIISGSGSFTLAFGGTINIGSSSGITTSGTSGNIRTSSRSFNSSANYIYSGNASQVTGNALPTTCTGNITINNNNSSGVTLSSNYTVNSPGIFTVNGILTCGVQIISGTGTFILAAGGTLQTSSIAGITSSGASGSIQTSSRNYNSAANYSFTGSSNQVCGNGMPASINNLNINNSSGGSSVKLSNNCTINGTLTLTNGVLCLNGNSLTISNGKTISRSVGSISLCSGSIIFGSSTNLTYTGNSNITTGPEMPTTSTGLSKLTINNSAGITLSSDITINTQLILTKGTISLSGHTMTYASGASLLYNGTSGQQIVSDVEWPSTFDKDITIANTFSSGVILHSNRTAYSGNLVVSGVFDVSNYTVQGGGTFTMNAGATFITAWSIGIVSTAGIQLSGGRTWNTGGNFVFDGSSAQVTGAEMPATINSLTINNSAGVSLSQSTECTSLNSTYPYYSLILESGALGIGSNTLTIDGDISQSSGTITGGNFSYLYIDGSTISTTLPSITNGLSVLSINRANAIITLGGDITVMDTLDLWAGSLDLDINTMTLDGVIDNGGGTLIGGTSSNITINDNSAAIYLPGILDGLNNLYINRPSNNIYLSGDLTVAGNMTLNKGAFNIGSNTLDLKGSLTTNSGSLAGGVSSNITIDSSGGTLTLPNVASGLNNLTIDRASGVNLGGNLNIIGVLALTFGTLSIGTHTLEIDGSISMGAGNINGGTSSDLTIGGNTSSFILPYISNGLQNFTLNNSNGISLGANLVVNNSVTFSSGSVTLGNYNFTLQNGNYISGYGSTSYFITKNASSGGGSLVQYVPAGIVVFPIGTSSSYTPATIDNSLGSADSFFVRVANNVLDKSTYGGRVSTFLQDVNKTWFISEKTPGTTSGASITLQWNSSDENTNFDENNSGISSFDGSNWDISNFSPYNSPSTGVLTATRSSLSTFNAFGVGPKNTALPVELLNFDAVAENHMVNIFWSTATEINNDHFTLERSVDGRHFEAIAEIKGAGTSNSINNYGYEDKFPLSGISYYRLKQVDYNGKFEYSKIAVIHFGNPTNDFNSLSVGPNPCHNIINIHLTTLAAGKVLMTVVDLTGKVLYTQSTDGLQGNNSLNLNVDGLAIGEYILQIRYDDQIINHLIVKCNPE